MRKSDRKMIANMFGALSRLTIISLYKEDDEDREEELVSIRDRLQDLVKEIEAWVEEE